MSVQKKIKKRRQRRTYRVRNRIESTTARPRVSVYRSIKQIGAQIIDDTQHRTVVSCSSLVFDAKGDKKAIAKAIGLELGKRAQAASITEVVFDRGSYRYGGRIAALADGMRESGIKF